VGTCFVTARSAHSKRPATRAERIAQSDGLWSTTKQEALLREHGCTIQCCTVGFTATRDVSPRRGVAAQPDATALWFTFEAAVTGFLGSGQGGKLEPRFRIVDVSGINSGCGDYWRHAEEVQLICMRSS
jgi:hypothetical protein